MKWETIWLKVGMLSSISRYKTYTIIKWHSYILSVSKIKKYIMKTNSLLFLNFVYRLYKNEFFNLVQWHSITSKVSNQLL